MTFCTKCGTQLDEQAQICPSCGNEVQSVPSQQPTAANAEQPFSPSSAVSNKMSTGKILVLVIIIAVLGLITLRAFHINGRENDLYSSPQAVLDAFSKAIENSDAESYYHTSRSKVLYADINPDVIDIQSGIFAEANSTNSLLIDGQTPQYKFSIEETQELDESFISTQESIFKTEIVEGYCAKVSLSFNGNKISAYYDHENLSDTMVIYLVKLKGEGWKIAYPYDSILWDTIANLPLLVKNEA